MQRSHLSSISTNNTLSTVYLLEANWRTRKYLLCVGGGEGDQIPLTVCPRNNGYSGISSHVWKCVRHIFDFTFDFICLWAVCVQENLLNQANIFKMMALNVDTNKKLEFRTFAGCHWFCKISCTGWCSFKRLSPPAGVAQINITDRCLIQLRL